jgi:hypothetical protein
MLRRCVGRMCAVTAVIALLLGGDSVQDSKKDHGVRGTVVKVDVSRSSLTIKTQSGRETFLLTGDTKIYDPRGKVSDDGIKDERLAAGNEVRVVLELSGKTVRELHLSSGKNAGKNKPSTNDDVNKRSR